MILRLEGVCSMDRIVACGERLLESLQEEDAHGLVHRCFCVFVEMAQNIMHHSGKQARISGQGPSCGCGAIHVWRAPYGILLRSDNPVGPHEVGNLQATLHQVNESCANGSLRTLTRERLGRPGESGGKGAGLGLIDMARKSGRPLRYSLAGESPGGAWFSLEVLVPFLRPESLPPA